MNMIMDTENRNLLMPKLFKHSNAITECSRLLSEMIWNDETIKKQFILAALADAVLFSANELEELLNYLPGHIAHDDTRESDD